MIEKWLDPKDQWCSLGCHKWSVARLFALTKDMPVMEVPIAAISVYYTYEKLTLRQMVTHLKAVLEADLDYPIILDEDGELMDGRHRIMKAMMSDATMIKIVKFDKNPVPCQIVE